MAAASCRRSLRSATSSIYMLCRDWHGCHFLTPADNGSAETRKLLWSHVLECYRTRLPHYVTRTRKVFENHKAKYDKLVTKLFGVLEEVASILDYDLGNHIITLHNQACTIDTDQMTKTDYEALVWQANELLRLTHFEIRLRPLLGATFANELRDCIVLLSRPQRAFDTAVRAALAFPTLEEA